MKSKVLVGPAGVIMSATFAAAILPGQQQPADSPLYLIVAYENVRHCTSAEIASPPFPGPGIVN